MEDLLKGSLMQVCAIQAWSALWSASGASASPPPVAVVQPAPQDRGDWGESWELCTVAPIHSSVSQQRSSLYNEVRSESSEKKPGKILFDWQTGAVWGCLTYVCRSLQRSWACEAPPSGHPRPTQASGTAHSLTRWWGGDLTKPAAFIHRFKSLL